MIRAGVWASVILGLLLILQTTLLAQLDLWGVRPSILLIVFVILASQNGGMVSQLVGFALGLAIDMITTAPLGYHAFIYALAGYLFGLGKGKVYFDPVVVPAIMAALATVFEATAGFFVSWVFGLGYPAQSFFQTGLIVQFLVNLAFSPVVFFLYNFLRQRFQDPRRGFDA